MNIFLQIYFLGVILALFYITYDFIEFCKENYLDYRYAFNDSDILFNILMDSLGSWVTLFVWWFGKNK